MFYYHLIIFTKSLAVHVITSKMIVSYTVRKRQKVEWTKQQKKFETVRLALVQNRFCYHVGYDCYYILIVNIDFIKVE